MEGGAGRTMSELDVNRQLILTLSSERTWRRNGLIFKESPDTAQNRGVHRQRDPAGLSVLLTWVIDAEQSNIRSWNIRFRSVRERIGGSRSDQALML